MSAATRKQVDTGFNWREALKFGAIGGVAVLFFCLVGMVEAFDARDVIFKTLSLGRSLLVVVALGMGYFSSQRLSARKPGRAVLTGLVVGVVSSVVTALLVFLAEPLNMREMFINASPKLIKILTFSQDSYAVGMLIQTGVMTGLSILGALLYLLPDLPRKLIINGLAAVLLIGMLQELLSVILARSSYTKPVAKFLFGSKGLSYTGAVVVFIVFALISAFRTTQSERIGRRYAGMTAPQQVVFRWVAIVAGVLFLIVLPQAVGPYISQILVLVGLYTLMGLGLNIEIGLAGLLDLGFVGFFAIGAYTTALLTSTSDLGLASVMAGEPVRASYTNFWVSIPVAVIVSGLAGVFLGIPVLRMRGDYLAIVTLGFAEIIRILVLSDFLRPVLGGAQGILNIPKPVLETFNLVIKDPGQFYYLIIIGSAIIAFVAFRLQNARIGRNWIAIREDEDVAEAMGINLIASKLLAFGIGAAFAGLSGAIFAAQVGSVFPHSFALIVSINVVSLVIIGGVGSIPGVIVGSLVLVGLPELLREFAEFRMLIYGAMLVIMMLVKPEGFWPSEVSRRELHTGEETATVPPVAETTGAA
ncbi:MAG: hypothetical protein D6784_15490 [Chloroflexi bacterium]|nr:MAG: hypothetical protein D6784_15490 [Chloroflexota bacterium]